MARQINVPQIDRATVERVYSGKVGRCMCGCAGHYSVNPGTITRIVNEINRLGPQSYPEHIDEFVFADSGGRTYCAYFHKPVEVLPIEATEIVAEEDEEPLPEMTENYPYLAEVWP